MERERLRSEQRFTRIFDAHYSAVRAYAWRRGPDSADDVVAETFTIAWQRLADVPAEPRPWLIGIARNVRLNQERSERRRREREMRSAVSAVVPSLAGAVEERASLGAALRRVSERDREILLLAAWESLDRAALAVALGCSRSAASVRLFRARRRLAAALADTARREAQANVSPRDPEGSLADDC